MRLLLTAVNCPKGDLATNLTRHLELVQRGSDERCDLVLLPEMSLTGYHPPSALTLDADAVRAVVAATTEAPAVCFGLVESALPAPYITQVVAARGQVVAVHRKAFLGEGESADFQPGPAAAPFLIARTACSLAVCAEIGTAAPYDARARLVLAPAAPGLYGERRRTDSRWRRGFDWWHGSVLADAARLLLPHQLLAVSTQAGSTHDEDFPGWAGLVAPPGRPVAELDDWREGWLAVDVPAPNASAQN